MSNPDLKNIQDKVSNGNFTHILQLLEDEKSKFSNKEAMHLIISCCSACNKNMSTPYEIDDSQLIKFLRNILKHIKTDQLEKLLDGYWQSLFFICKLLLKKKNYELVVGMEGIFLPHFLPSELSTKQITLFKNISGIIYNEITCLANTRTIIYNDVVISMCYLLTKMFKKCMDMSEFIDYVYKCNICLSLLCVDSEKQFLYYLHNLSFFDDETEDPSKAYKNIIKYTSHVYIGLYKEQKFISTDKCLGTMLSLIDNKDEWLYLKKSFRICSILIPAYEMDNINNVSLVNKCTLSLQKSFDVYGPTNNLQTTCQMIVAVAVVFIQYYKQLEPAKRFLNNTGLQLKLYELFSTIRKLLMEFPYKCDQICNCNTKQHIVEGTKSTLIIASLAKFFMIDGTFSLYFVKQVLQNIELFCDLLICLKQNGCKEWVNCWVDVGLHLYNMAIQLFKSNHFEESLLFSHSYLRYFINLYDIEDMTADVEMFILVLGLISTTYLKQKHFIKAIIFNSMEIIRSTGETQYLALTKWVKIKISAKETNPLDLKFQQLTVCSIMDKFDIDWKNFLPTPQIPKKLEVSLLISELNVYKKIWKSKLPMMAVYQELCKVADVCTLAKVFIQIWDGNDTMVHENIPKLLKLTLVSFEKCISKEMSPSEKEIYLSFLYFLYHQLRVKDIIVKNIQEMNKTLKEVRPITDPTEIVADPNEECDVVSSYESLKLDKQLLKYVDKSADLLEKLFGTTVSKNLLNKFQPKSIYTLVRNLAFEYKLHCNKYRSLRAWSVALNIAETLCDETSIIECVGFMARISNSPRTLLMKKEEEIISELEKFSTEYKLCIIYYINLSTAYLHVDSKVAFQYYDEAMTIFQSWQVDDNEKPVVEAQLCLLNFKLSLLPCKLQIDKHQSFYPGKIFIGSKILIGKYETEIFKTEDLIILFEVQQAIIQWYHDLRMPREVKCYGKDLLILSQKLIVPLRCAILLNLLARADFHSCKLDDCKVKIQGLSHILCLSNYSYFDTPEIILEPVVDCVEYSNSNVDSISRDLQKIQLYKPNSYTREASNSSPTMMVVERSKLPSFTKHIADCDCFYCTCEEYQQLCLIKLNLDAVWLMHQNQTLLASSYFTEALHLCKTLSTRNKHSKKSHTRLLLDTSNEDNTFLERHCSILLDYAHCLKLLHDDEDANTTNKELITILSEKKLEYPYLYSEALSQRLSLLSSREMPQNVITNQSNEIATTIMAQAVDVKFKTPESKKVRMPVNNVRSPKILRPGRIGKIKLNLSDSENVKDNVNKKSPTYLMPLIVQGPSNTPVPNETKIEIYTLKSDKSKQKSKRVLSSIPVPENYKDANNVNTDISTPKNCGSTEKKCVQLESRTKALTDKIKKSVKTEESTSTKVAKPVTRTKSISRKNLLKCLDDEVVKKDENKGIVRRSRRNKT